MSITLSPHPNRTEEAEEIIASETPEAEASHRRNVSDVRMSRRGMFAALMALAATPLISGSNNQRHESSGQCELLDASVLQHPPFRRLDCEVPNRAILENDHGRNTIIYLNHDEAMNLDGIPGDIDGVVMDLGGLNKYEAPGLYFEKDESLKPLEEFVVSNGIPIFAMDYAPMGGSIAFAKDVVPEGSLGRIASKGADSAILFGSSVWGAVLMEEGLRSKKRRSKRKKRGEKASAKEGQKKSVSRRCFSVVAGLYFLQPLLNLIARHLSTRTECATGTTEDFSRLTHKMHPWQGVFLTRLRDAVISVKMRHMMEQRFNESGKKQHFVTTLGGNHSMYADYMQESLEEALSYLRGKKLFLNYSEAPETLYTIEQRTPFTGSSKTWRFEEYEVPQLKEIAKGNAEDAKGIVQKQ